MNRTYSQKQNLWCCFDNRTRLIRCAIWLAMLLVTAISWNWIARHTTWEFVLDAHRQGLDLASRMLPPNWRHAQRLWLPIWDTINIATLGTSGAIIMALPVALLAARNLNTIVPLRWLAMLLIVVSRSVNSLIWAMLFVAVLGPGTLAGVLAITMRSIGFVAKLIYEAFEEIDPVPIEAMRAVGATPLLVFIYGFLPQILPAATGISLLRWDINIRESTVLGLVGAGGIGLQLSASVNSLQWQNAAVVFLMIIGLVLFSEFASARLRRRLI